VKGKNGPHTFTVYFLPRNWVGIRKIPNAAPGDTYWEGILTDGSVLTITASTDREFHHQFWKTSPWGFHPQHYERGFEDARRVFRGRRATVDSAAEALHARPRALQTMTYDLSSVIKPPGSHTVQYIRGAAKSALITVNVVGPGG
jgi:hypothetical protein